MIDIHNIQHQNTQKVVICAYHLCQKSIDLLSNVSFVIYGTMVFHTECFSKWYGEQKQNKIVQRRT